MSESSSSEDSPPSRRRRTIPSLPAMPALSLVGKNGHEWSTRSTVDPSTKAVPVNDLTQRRGLTTIGEKRAITLRTVSVILLLQVRYF